MTDAFSVAVHANGVHHKSRGPCPRYATTKNIISAEGAFHINRGFLHHAIATMHRGRGFPHHAIGVIHKSRGQRPRGATPTENKTHIHHKR